MLKFNYLCVLVIGSILVTGCATGSKLHRSKGKDASAPTSGEIESISKRSELDFEGLEKQFGQIEGSIKSEDLSGATKVDRPGDVAAVTNATNREGITLQFNEHVKRWIKYFVVRSKARFQRYLDRGERYRDVVEETLRKHGLPAELYYLAMIESGYANHARSPKAAVGAWQFIPGTGRRYGLDLNRYIDERRDPIRASEAASRYLTDLFNVFNSWYLAMAAYNAGEGRVLGAIMRGNTRDFWELVRKKKLPRETRNYIPKFMAAAIIGRNPERFGFRTPRAEPYPDVEAIELPSPVRLRDISRQAGIPLDLLKKVNFHLLKGVTPPNKRTYDVWIPIKYVASVQSSYKSLASKRLSKLSTKAFARRAANPNYHTVRSGESLYSIASKYRISVAELKRANKIRSNRIIAGSRLRVAASGYVRQQGRVHRVRRGETLSSISRKYGMEISDLKRLNRMRNSRIYVGQKINVKRNRGSSTVVSRAKAEKSDSVRSQQASSRRIHIVKSGENLSRIAKRYGMSVQNLMRINGLQSPMIHKGMRIRLVASARKSTQNRRKGIRRFHVVKPGENLFRIAKRYGQSVNQLMQLNSLKSKVIHPGVKIVVAVR